MRQKPCLLEMTAISGGGLKRTELEKRIAAAAGDPCNGPLKRRPVRMLILI